MGPVATADAAMTAAATESAELTKQGRVVGTVAYMSPEQAQGRPVDARSDVFAFGTMLYEMATGKRPFLGETGINTIAKILESEVPRLEDVVPDVPINLDRIVRRCLQKDPAARYNDTRDLVVDLKELQEEVTSGVVRTASGSIARSTVTGAPPWSLFSGRGAKLAAAAVGVAVVSAIAWRVLDTVPSTPLAPATSSVTPTHRQVTFVGDAWAAAVSPDGRSIAYLAGSGDSQAVHLQDVTGGRALEVFRGDVRMQPRWSPDGSQLLVTGSSDIGDGTFLVPRLGGSPRRIGRFADAAWSPEGSQLAGILTARKSIFVTETSTGEVTEVPLSEEFTFIRDVDWSPTGDFFAVVVLDGMQRSTLRTVSVDGARQSTVLEDDAGIQSPRWSAAGDAIYYWRDEQQAGGLWKIRVSGDGTALGAPTPLLAGVPVAPPLSITADGAGLLYARGQSWSNLWIATAAGQGPDVSVSTRQLTTGTLMDQAARVSPDGGRVAFSRSNGRTSNIFVAPIDGGPVQQLTFLISENSAPVWSPDGSEIAFGSTEGHVARVWKVAARGGSPQLFDGSELSASFGLEWAPGRDILYQLPGNRNFSVLDPTTGDERPLIDDDSVGWAFNPRYSPDGSQVVAYWNRRLEPGGETPDGRGLWMLSLEETVETRVLPSESPTYVNGWSADGAWIYVQNDASESLQIERIPVDGGAPETVATLPWTEVSDCDIVGDRQFVCGVFAGQSDVWLAENFDPDVR